MTSKDRILAAVEHRVSDRTPITFDAEKEVYSLLYSHLGLHTKEELFDRLNVDTWMVLPTIISTPASEDNASVWGWKTKTATYSGGTYEETCFNPLAGKDSISDIDAHPWPNADMFDFSQSMVDATAHQDRAVIGAFTWGAYFLATNVRGMENLMLDFAFDINYAEHLIRTIADRTIEILDRMLEVEGEGIDIVYMADDYCSQLGPLFSPDVFRKLVFPYLAEIVEKVHRHEKKFLLHCCGAVRPLLPMIIEAGVDILEPIQVSAQGMEPVGLKRDFGRDLCFYGGVDLQNTLVKGTPDQVADEVKYLIDVLGDGGGYIIGPGHTYIQVDAPVANVMSMYETAFAYGSES